MPLEFAAVWAGGTLWVLWALRGTLASKIRLALYFEGQVPGPPVWSEVLARNCVYLDELCAGSAVTTLSSFGFADDWSSATMVWHAPEKGLETIAALSKELRSDSTILAETDAILSDLQAMENRLRAARANPTRFCFLLHGAGINGMEIYQRCGYF